ncbi:MAG: AsmA family protein [Rikenellaceae bacterium]
MIIIRRIFVGFLILVGVILAAWGVIIGLIATPEVITPQIVKVLQQHTKSEVSIKSVDLSLFHRFPNVTLRIDSLRIAQTKDSIGDLIFARQCRIAVDPVAILQKKLQINHFSLRNASIYLYVDSLHGPMKTFILPESQEQQDTTSSSQIDLSEYSLSLRRLKIDSTQIVIDDRTKQFYTRVDNYNADMSMNLSSKVGDLEVKTGFSNLIVWRAGDLLVKKTSLDLRSTMQYDRDSMTISFDRARMMLNGIDLKVRGVLRRDTVANGIQVDLKSMLNTPSLSEFLALVPTSIIDGKDEITTEGEVTFKMDVEGLYSEESVPSLGVTIDIKNAKAKYASRKLALENVNCDAYAFVDFNTPKNSYADIKSLQINTSQIIDLNISGRVNNILDNPAVDASIKSTIDFDRFTEVFPLNEGLICKGKGVSNLKTQFTLSNVQNSNYADLYLDGETSFTNLDITYDASKFDTDTTEMASLYIQAETGKMLFGDNIKSENNSRTLRTKVNFTGLGYKSKSGEYVTIKNIELTGGANFDQKTSQMNGFGVQGLAQNMVVGVDSLFSASLESSDVTFIVVPPKENSDTKLKAIIKSNQIVANEPTFNSTMRLSSVDISATMQKLAPKEWDTEASISFSKYDMMSDLFPLDVKIPQTTVSLSNKTIYLKNADLILGKSRFKASGNIHNLLRKMFVDPKAALSGELAINASYIDIGELVEASNKSVLLLESEESTESYVETGYETTTSTSAIDPLSMEPIISADSMALDSLSTMFLVPRRMDFSFDLNIAKARLERGIIENVAGRAVIKNGAVTLEKLTLNAIGADIAGSVIYRNINPKSSNVMANLTIADIDITRVDELMPSINAMYPMMGSLEGNVDLDVKLNTNINEMSEPEIPTLFSAIRFKGKNLVLMDSETFADISKSLMFKNKDRNLIDSMEFYALVAASQVDILPFEMSIDRYTAIIGGSQVIDPTTFDVDYDYHISILKSPLPFKAGLDIAGDLVDYNFKITKAKLKKTNFADQLDIYSEYRGGIDASSNALQEEIDAKRQAAFAKRQARRLEQERLEAEAAALEGEITNEGILLEESTSQEEENTLQEEENTLPKGDKPSTTETDENNHNEDEYEDEDTGVAEEEATTDNIIETSENLT